MSLRLLCTLFVVATTLASACAPKLTVRHEDPAFASVEIRIDGERQGFLTPNDKMTVRLSRGWHEIAAIPEGETQNPWSETGEPWTLYLDKRAHLTLLPR